MTTDIKKHANPFATDETLSPFPTWIAIAVFPAVALSLVGYDHPGVVTRLLPLWVLVSLNTRSPVKLALNRKMLAICLAALAAWCGYELFFMERWPFVGEPLKWVAVGTSFFVFIPAVSPLSALRRFPGACALTFFAMWTREIYHSLNEFAWPYFCKIAVKGVIAVVTLMHLPTVSRMTDYGFIAESANFRLRIYSACSGLEGILTIIYLIVLFALANWRRFTWGKIARLVLAGSSYMLALNIFRISVFFYLSDRESKRHGRYEAYYRSMELFHNDTGFLIYAAGMIGFFACYLLAQRYLNGRRTSAPSSTSN